MTLAANRKRIGRHPVSYVELDLDFCQNTFSILPCTASAAAGGECYNTRSTCQDIPNYNKGVQTYRFIEAEAQIPVGFDAIPCLPKNAISLAPTRLTLGKGLSTRASVSVRFQDFPHHDRGVDPYVATRNYIPIDNGTFFGKLLARNPFYQSRIMRIYSGYIVDGIITPANFDVRTYVIETVQRDKSGNVTITAKDMLKLADDKRAQIPVPSEGLLNADILAAATTLDLQVDQGAAYPASGIVRIGDEILSYSGVTVDQLTGLVRGLRGTLAEDHKTDDSVQLCEDLAGMNVVDAIEHILTNFTTIDAATFIPSVDWGVERDQWLSLYTFGQSAIVSEPTGVLSLIQDIMDSTLLNMWWDERAQQIKLKALAPYDFDTELTDAAHFIDGSVSVKALPKERLSQVWFRYGLRDATKPGAVEEYASIKVQADLTKESVDLYGEPRFKIVKSRWYNSSGPAIAFASRMLKMLSTNPVEAKFDLDAKDAALWTADPIDLISRAIQGVDGSDQPTELFITEVKEKIGGTRFSYMATTSPFFGRFAKVMANGTPDYAGENKGGYIAPDANGFSDGGEAFKIA